MILFRTLAVATLAACILGVSVASAAPFPVATPESEGMSSEGLRSFTDVVRTLVTNDDIVGAELLVIKNGKCVLHESLGWKDRESQTPMAPDTIFCIRSMTKTIVGAAAQMLIDEGKLSLADTAAKYLPSFDNDKSRAITIEQLLSHTSGLPLSLLVGRQFSEYGSVRAVADEAGEHGPDFPPGSSTQYSDEGADTLTAIIGVITGDSPERFLETRIFAPLGMTDSICVLSKEDPRLPRVASAYLGKAHSWMRFANPPNDGPIFPFFLGSQGMYSSLADYARFLSLWMSGGEFVGKRLLSADAIARVITTPGRPFKFPTRFDSLGVHYSQFMTQYVATAGPNAGKVVAFGHTGSDGTYAYAFPDRNLIVCYFTQSRGNRTGDDIETAIQRILLDGDSKWRPAAPVAVAADAAAQYTGLYWMEDQSVYNAISLENGELRAEFTGRGVVPLVRDPQNPDRWTLKGAQNQAFTFERSPDAGVTGLVFSAGDQTFRWLRFIAAEPGTPSLDEVMALRAAAHHPERLAQLGAVRLTGAIDIPAQKRHGTITNIFEGEARFRSDTVTGETWESTVLGPDGAWGASNAAAKHDLEGPRAEQVRLASVPVLIADWRAHYTVVRPLRVVNDEGVRVVLVQTTPKSGPSSLKVVNAATGELINDCRYLDIPGLGIVGDMVTYSDYRDVDGVRMPFHINHQFPIPMLGSIDAQFEKAETHVSLPADAFDAPRPPGVSASGAAPK